VASKDCESIVDLNRSGYDRTCVLNIGSILLDLPKAKTCIVIPRLIIFGNTFAQPSELLDDHVQGLPRERLTSKRPSKDFFFSREKIEDGFLTMHPLRKAINCLLGVHIV